MQEPASSRKATVGEPASPPEPRLPSPGFRLGHQPGLDGIRGTAVVLIMMYHSFIVWDALYGRLMPGAYITLNVFFVLSGFLITSLLLAERERHGRVSFRSFYQRRALRLLPALAFLLTVFTGYVLWRHRDVIGDAIAAIGWISVYASNWAQFAGRFDDLYTALSLGHTWTLAVEEQFYLLWPVLLVLLLRARCTLRTLAWVLAGGVVIVTIERAILTARVSFPVGASDADVAATLERVVGIRTDLRADTLLLGALAAVLLHAGWRPGRSVRWAGSSALLLLVLASAAVQPHARWMFSWGFTAVDIAAAVLCVAVLDAAWLPGKFFRARPIPWLGRMSYALYLWHLPVFVAVAVDLPQLPAGTSLAIAWVVAFGLAAVSYYFVELPFLRLKDRLSARAYGDAASRTAPEPVVRPATG